MINETVRQIEEMQTQSSSIVAVKAAKALRDLLEREYPTTGEFVRDLERSSHALRRANYSHAPLYTSQERIVSAVTDEDPETVEEGKELLEAAIDEVVTEITTSKQTAAEKAATLIDDGDVLLTHENSSTVMATFDHAIEDDKSFDVYATESRPRFLGRKTARQLAERDNVDATLIIDSAAGHYLSEVDRVFLGMNCLIEDTVYNRIGTYPIVTTAAHEDVPVTVVASSAKFIGSGFGFENNHRPTSEVMCEPADGFEIANPGYDATPTEFLDSVVTENGVMRF